MRTLKLLRATVAFVLLLFVSISCRQTENTLKIPAGGTEFMEWMPKNLTTSTFRNGDSIPEVKVDKEWFEAAKEGRPAWCYYNNDPANGKTYGKLYNWYAVNDARGLAPKGWHIPTDREWQILVVQWYKVLALVQIFFVFETLPGYFIITALYTLY